jgi:hypothetical protein
VDRVLLSISGPYGSDEKTWAEAIEATVANIRSRYPAVRRIILQAVVGGPNGEPCPAPGGGQRMVRASWQHPHIVNAIKVVVARSAGGTVGIVSGAQPTVRRCEDYADALGHLTPTGAEAVARMIADYYSAPAAANQPAN